MTARTALSLGAAVSLLCAASGARAGGASQREGFMFAAVAGPSGYFGVGSLSDAKASGGMVIFRFGTQATDSLQLLIEFDLGAFADGFGQIEDSLQNNHTVITLGMQKYLADVVWIRGGIGRAWLDQAAKEAQFVGARDERGLGLMAGLGYDVFRRGTFALDIELTFTSGIYGGSAMIHSGLGLGLNWY